MLSTVSPPQTILRPPAWVDALLATSGDEWKLHSHVIARADRHDDAALQSQVRIGYQQILSRVSAAGHRPVRFWNNVPHLTASASEQRNRYMVFNAGRYEALSEFHGNPSQFDAHIAAATAIGAEADDVKIYCLSSTSTAWPLANPRQVAPYHYSKRFGPLPPCFARAVRLDAPANWLIVGGTAAIRGEDSIYREDLSRQLHETFTNLSALVAAALGETITHDKSSPAHLLAYRELRAYFPNPEHEAEIRDAIQRAFGNLRRLEFVIADLCRPELLVEIEGLAELPS